MLVEVDFRYTRSEFKEVDLVYMGNQVDYTVDYLFKGLNYLNVPVVKNNDFKRGFGFSEQVYNKLIEMDRRIKEIDYTVIEFDFITGGNVKGQPKLKELDIYVEDNVFIGVNEAWVFETDEETNDEWKVYIKVAVNEILKVSVNFDKPEGLLCKVSGYIVKD